MKNEVKQLQSLVTIVIKMIRADYPDTTSVCSKNSMNLGEFKKRIKLMGFVKNMREIYSKTNIVILPSWREGLSKSLIEAASMSLPIITTNVPGCKEIIENNKSGILIPLKNKPLLKKAIKKLIRNPEIGIKFGLKAREIVKSKFEMSYINNKILKIYNNLIF